MGTRLFGAAMSAILFVMSICGGAKGADMEHVVGAYDKPVDLEGRVPEKGLTAFVYPMGYNLFSYNPNNWITTKRVAASGVKYNMASSGALLDDRVVHPYGWRLEGLIYIPKPGYYDVRTRVEWGDFRDSSILCKTRLSLGSRTSPERLPIVSRSTEARSIGIAYAKAANEMAVPLSYIAQIPFPVAKPGYYEVTTEVGCAPITNNYGLYQLMLRGGPTINVESRDMVNSDSTWNSDNFFRDVYQKQNPRVAPTAPKPGMVQGWTVAAWPTAMGFDDPVDDAKPLTVVRSPAFEPQIGAGFDKLNSVPSLGYSSVARSTLVVPEGMEGNWPIAIYVTAPKGIDWTAKCVVFGRFGSEGKAKDILFDSADLSYARSGRYKQSQYDITSLQYGERPLSNYSNVFSPATQQLIKQYALTDGDTRRSDDPNAVGRVYFLDPLLDSKTYNLTITTYCGSPSPQWDMKEQPPQVNIYMRPPGYNSMIRPVHLWTETR